MNEIIAGYRSGSIIKEDPNKQLAYIGIDEYFTKVLVADIKLVNSTTEVDTSAVFRGAMMAGAMGALAGASASTEILVEIFWKNGEKSIAKVTRSIFERMLVGVNTEYTEEQVKQIGDYRREKEVADHGNDNVKAFVIMIVVFIVGFLLFMPLL